jgi:hypothetical protein
MKRLAFLCMMTALCLPLQRLRAQDKPQDKPKSEDRTKAATAIKVQIVVSEFDGDKKISSTPYSFMVIADDLSRGPYGTSLRTGVRIPVEIEGKEQKTTYIDVGFNIDCGIRSEEDGRYRVGMSLERSALHPNQSSEGEKMVSTQNGQPVIRQFRTQEILILKDGQTSEAISSTDPISGHVLRVSVTLNVQK